MNDVLFFASIITTFSAVVMVSRIFGRAGLFAWVAFATIMANILTAKQVTIFGLDVTMGTILFSSVFLVSDILNEKHGAKEAKKAACIAFASAIGYIIVTNISLLYVPNALDFSSDGMRDLFGTSLRISISSAVMFLLANLADVTIYNFIKRRNGALWLRNNVSSIISNGFENFAFITIAFLGIMPFHDIMIIAAGTTVIEIIVSVCGTPFFYLSTRQR